MSSHYIYAWPDVETEARIHFVFHPYVPMRGPSYASGGEPEEPASIEFDGVQKQDPGTGKWIDAEELAEWADAYLHGDGQADAFETAHDDHIAGQEYAAEMRAESQREAREYERSRPSDEGDYY